MIIAILIASGIVIISGAAILLALRLRSEPVKSDCDAKPTSGIERMLLSDRFGLSGRPDAVLREHGEYVPIVIVPRRASRLGPYTGEILQVASLCLLVEEHHGRTVRRGRLQYLNRSVDIEFDDALRGRLLRTIKAVDHALSLPGVSRSHSSPAKCRRCPFHDECGQALG